MAMTDEKADDRVQMTVRQLHELSDRKILFSLLKNGTETLAVIDFMKHQCNRSQSWVYKMKNRFKKNPHNLFPKPIPGRKRKMTENMKMTVGRNLRKKNKLTNKSTRQLAEHFDQSSKNHEGIVSVSQ
jgi:transposase